MCRDTPTREEASSRFHPVLEATVAAVGFVGATWAPYSIQTGGLYLLTPLSQLLMALFLLAGALLLFGHAIWRTWARGDLRPALLCLLSALLASILFILAVQRPASYLATMAGALASMIIAVAASAQGSLATAP